MNRTFKIIGRHPYTGRQQKKRVYTSSSDYDKYSGDLIARYKTYMNVECYELIDGKWKEIDTAEYEGGSVYHKRYES